MAAGIKYGGSFFDRYGRNVTVFLTAADYAGAVYPLQFGDDPIHIRYKGEDGEALQTMISSEASIQILFKDDGSPLLGDIFTMDEDTFGVLIVVRNPDFSIVIRWQGWLVPDDQTRSFSTGDQPVTLKAIDVITRLKGQKMTNSAGAYITGPNSLKYYIDNCFAGCFTGSSTMIYSTTILSDMVVSSTTSTTLPSILEQLGTYAEAFNDSDGRPLTAYDVVKGIASSLNMRVFYENFTIYFIDNLKYSGLPTSLPINATDIKILDVDGASEANSDIVIGNKENITTLQTYSETSCKFEYRNSVGLLNDGYFQNWEVAGSGFKLAEWFYSPYLTFRPDVNNRRQGTGRVENPYSMKLTYTADHVSGDNYEHRFFDVICGKTPDKTKVTTGQQYTLDFTVKLLNPDLIPYVEVVDGWQKIVNLPIYIVIYNETDPTKSYWANNTGSNHWETIDLSGTDFATGNPDWIAMFGDYDAALNPGAPSSYQNKPLGFVKYACLMPLSDATNLQSGTIEMAPVPDNCKGNIYVFVHPAVNTRTDLAPTSADTVVSKMLLSAKTSDVAGGTYRGEIQYINRDITTSLKGDTKDMVLNTTENVTVAGSLYNAIPYVEGATTVDAGTNLLKIALSGSPEPLLSGVKLMTYNAIAAMYLNYPQYKIDFETIGTVNFFYNYLRFPSLYDPSKIYTEIFNLPYIQTASDYNVKRGSRTVTAVSMKLDIRAISENTLNETTDFSEYYNLS